MQKNIFKKSMEESSNYQKIFNDLIATATFSTVLVSVGKTLTANYFLYFILIIILSITALEIYKEYVKVVLVQVLQKDIQNKDLITQKIRKKMPQNKRASIKISSVEDETVIEEQGTHKISKSLSWRSCSNRTISWPRNVTWPSR